MLATNLHNLNSITVLKLDPKFLLTALISIGFCTKSLAVTRVGVGVNWTNAASWLPSGVPASGDSLVIPASVIISISTNVGSTLLALRINISCELTFDKGKLELSSTSLIYLQNTGSLTCVKCNNSEQIRIGSASNKVYDGSCGPVSGPGVITASYDCSSGTLTPLPIRVLIFNYRHESGNLVLQWYLLVSNDIETLKL